MFALKLPEPKVVSALRSRSVRDQSAADMAAIVDQEAAKRDAAVQGFNDSMNILASLRDEALSIAQSGGPGADEYQTVADNAEDLIRDLGLRV